MRKDTKVLLIDGVHGVNIPSRFYHTFDFKGYGLDQANYSELSDNGNDGYDEAWQDVLDNAVFKDEDGVKWTLQMIDGDLFGVSEHHVDLDQYEEIDDDQLHREFDTFIDELTPEITILGCTYLPSSVLRDTDPTAYRCGFNDWLDGEVKDGRYMEVQDVYYIEK